MSNRIATDGIANVLRFLATVGSTLAITPVIIRSLAPDAFAVWTLAIAVSAYISLAEVGIQSAVTRFVTVDLETREGRVNSVLASAIWMLTMTIALAMAVLTALVLGTTWVFADVPEGLLPSAREAVVILGFGVGANLMGGTAAGYFFAVHRAIVPAVVTIVVKLSTAAALIVVALTTHSVVWLAVTLAAGNVVGAVISLVLVRRAVGQPIAQPSLVTRMLIRRLGRHSWTLIGWSFAMLAISGLDLVIVGAFDFDAVGPYGIAAQGIALILGLTGAAIAPLSAAAARRHVTNTGDEVARLVIGYSRIVVTLLVIVSSVLFVAAPGLVGWYAGPKYGPLSATILRILLLGNVIRNTCAPLGTVLIATGEHKGVILSPFMEALANVSLSLILVQAFGAIGVAWGTVIGSVVGVSLHMFVTLRRTKTFRVPRAQFLREAMSRPAICAIPAAIIALKDWDGLFGYVLAGVVCAAVSIPIAWRWSLVAIDRQRIISLLRRQSLPSVDQ